jgi:hypothetical protein
MRDGVVLVVLLADVLLAIMAWHPLGRWVSLSIGVLGLLVAAFVYRMRPPASPANDHPQKQSGDDEATGRDQ